MLRNRNRCHQTLVDAASIVLNEGSTLAISDLQMRLYLTSGNSNLLVPGDSPAGLLAGM